MLVSPWIVAGAVACGGNVVVDSGAASGSGAGATTGGTGATNGVGAGSTTSTSTATSIGAGTGTGTNAACNSDLDSAFGEEQSALGCTPTDPVPQCTGAATVHDICGCVVIANEAHPQTVEMANAAWMACVSDGCCGAGCAPCQPAPTVGYCDSFTSQCKSGVPPP